MDKLEQKLESDNPIVLSQVFSQVFECAYDPQKQKPTLDFLKLKCKSDNPLVSEAAAEVLILLAQEDRFDIESMLADFTSFSTSTKQHDGTIKVITNLYFLHQKKKYEKSKVLPRVLPKINLTQHPLIQIIKENLAAQVVVFHEMIQCYRSNSRFSTLIIRLYEPVFLYTICHPGLKLELNFIGENLWTFVLNTKKINNKSVFKILCWLQTESRESLQVNHILLVKLLETFFGSLNNEEVEIIILKLILVLYQMILNRINCKAVLQALKETLSKVNQLSVANVALLILTRCILICSSIYLMDLLEISKILLGKSEVCFYSYCLLKFASLVWIANLSVLTRTAKASLNDVLTLETSINFQATENSSLEKLSKQYSYILDSDFNISLSVHICLKMESTKQYLPWLAELDFAPIFGLKKIFYVLCGLALNKTVDDIVHEKVLSLILKCVETDYDLAYPGLVLILYQLSDPRCSKMHFKLLKALPHMACLKENGPKVVATIQALAKQSELNNLALTLMFSMWERDKSYYHNLETLINIKSPELLDDTSSTITDALILKKLCEQCPHLYGKDMVPRLSKILNDCNNKAGAIPCALAIEGITSLCKFGVIDVITTWTTLSKKFKADERVPVIKSLCQLIAAIPELQYTEAHEHLNTEVVTHLWHYVTNSDKEEVVSAAFNALCCFSLEAMSAHIPEQFLDENVRDNPSQLKCVSGTIWINLLSNCNFPKASTNFLIKLVSTEVENYLKYVYQVKGQGEPPNYNYLPSHSIVRALCSYVKSNMNKISEWKHNPDQQRIYVVCLYILSRKYCKSLPPLDWSFLHELIHEPLLRISCLEIACHQVIISGSARSLVENVILAYTNDQQVREVTILYQNLDFLANSIQPVTLKPFTKNTLGFAIKLFNQDPSFLQTLVHEINCTLRNSNVQDINKQSIAEVLGSIISEVDVSSKIFTILLECVVNVPTKNQEEIGRLNLEAFDKEHFERKSKIRCLLATRLDLHWLDDLIEIGSKNNVRSVIFRDLLEVFKTQANNNQVVFWFLEVLGQIQAKITNGCPQKEINYFCDILLLATVSFSGCFAFLPEDSGNINQESLTRLFPQALALLLSEEVWSISKEQILESLHYLNFEEAIDKGYQCVFGQALCALRHDMEFSKNLKWMKYMDCDIENETS